MAANQGSATDFWAALGVGQETEPQRPEPPDPQPPAAVPAEKARKRATGKNAPPPERTKAPPSPDHQAAPLGEQGEWASMFSSGYGSAGTTVERQGQAGPSSALAAGLDWAAAEQIADRLRPQLAKTWIEILARHTDGDPVMAGKVYDVLSGWNVLGELWRDENIKEVHVRGAQVTVCGPLGVSQTPGFRDLATARMATEAVTAAQERTGIVVTRVGDSFVMSRGHDPGKDMAALIAAGVVSEGQLSQVEHALQRMRTVTVSGAAAPVIVRAFASLIPAGSRVFEGSYGVLPPGCVAAASPLDADYVVGVRPGAVAEEMAAAGQLGALIANPELQFSAAMQLTVKGRSMAPEEVSAN